MERIANFLLGSLLSYISGLMLALAIVIYQTFALNAVIKTMVIIGCLWSTYSLMVDGYKLIFSAISN